MELNLTASLNKPIVLILLIDLSASMEHPDDQRPPFMPEGRRSHIHYLTLI